MSRHPAHPEAYSGIEDEWDTDAAHDPSPLIDGFLHGLQGAREVAPYVLITAAALAVIFSSPNWGVW